MRTDTPFLLATTVGVGSIVGGELAPMLQAHTLAHDLWVGGWVLFLVALWGYHFRQPLLAGIGRLGHRARSPAPITPPVDEWLTLAEAARIASDHAHSTPLGHIIDGAWRKLSEDEEDFLHMWASRIATELAVPVYGTRIGSARVQRIPLDDLENTHFRRLATLADLGNNEPMNDFENLKVKRHEIEAGLAKITEPREPGE